MGGQRTGWRARAGVVLTVTAAVTAAAATTGGSAAAATRAQDRTQDRTQARASAKAPVVVIVMENKEFKAIVRSSNAPFINKTMIAKGTLYTDYIAAPGSLPDYLEMVSGRLTVSSSAPNLFAALGRSVAWREFEESMPSACYRRSSYKLVEGTRAGLYIKGHNPAMQFSSVAGTSLCKNVVPLTRAYFKPWALPAFSYVVPNECDDMHTLPAGHQCPMWNGSVNTAPNPVKMGDNWLAAFVPTVARYATVILTWDEGAPSNERVVTVMYGRGVSHGRSAAHFTHASLEAALYARFTLGQAPGDGGAAAPLPIP